jgi:hypothetical protein
VNGAGVGRISAVAVIVTSIGLASLIGGTGEAYTRILKKAQHKCVCFAICFVATHTCACPGIYVIKARLSDRFF